jgi:ribosomal protein L32
MLDTEDITILEMVEDHEICCDYADSSFCPKDAAKWVAHGVCYDCGFTANRLICTPCKDLVTTTDAGLSCGNCGEVVVPARHVFDRIEPL